MRAGRPTAELTLTTEERHTLEQWTRQPKTAQALTQRTRIVLACAAGQANRAEAAQFKTTGQTVRRWSGS
jgi:DNA-binding NarL/FixJ family response regulator